ncbi:uncharacterized protein [Triticum aestivum]|uniref:uncharacterized protein n=1 Tax=Triticum aestivum TaxID=4565 RepID=UPI001D00370D|nr:uncharacterized protein LOC123059813 [Triticum aestivum]
MAGRRRSRSRIQGDGATRPRRLRSRVVGSEDGDGATRPSRRRSRVVGSEDGDGATRPSRRRRASSPEVPDEADADTLWESLPLDMIWEILLLLPPERPSLVLPPKRRSFLRASGVSTLWRGVATDPNFMSQHRRKWKPPLLGVFERRQQKFHFTPVLHPPDRIPADRIHISGWMTSRDCDATDCRHGRVLAQAVGASCCVRPHHRPGALPALSGRVHEMQLPLRGCALCCQRPGGPRARLLPREPIQGRIVVQVR